jgi:hypothetical protein
MALNLNRLMVSAPPCIMYFGIIYIYVFHYNIYSFSGFGGLVVSMLASYTQVRRFKPGEKIRMGSKAVCPMS